MGKAKERSGMNEKIKELVTKYGIDIENEQEFINELCGLFTVSGWVVCAEMQPEEEGTYLVKNKYELTGEYHIHGEWAGKWTTDDTNGYEVEIYVSEWRVI